MKKLLWLALLIVSACAPGSVIVSPPTNGDPVTTYEACLGIFTFDWRNPYGARISSLQGDGPVAAARIRQGDVIVSFGRYSAVSSDSLESYLRTYRPGDVVAVRHARERLGLYWDYYTSDVVLGKKLAGESYCQRVR